MNQFLRGRRCYLRALTVADLADSMPRFVADRDVVRYLVRGTYPSLPEEGRAEYEKLVNNRDEVQFAAAPGAPTLKIVGIARSVSETA